MASLQSRLEDTRSIEELFEAACGLEDDDARWEVISIIHLRGGEKAFNWCLELLKSESWQFCKRCGWFDDAEQRADPELGKNGNLRSLSYERERWRQRVEMARKIEDNKP